MSPHDLPAEPDSDVSRTAIWRSIRQRAHQLATRGRHVTDGELDDFTRLVESLPAPRTLPSAR